MSVQTFLRIVFKTSIRGALGSFLPLFETIGILYSYSIGPFVSYVVLWILCAILPVIFFVCFIMMPESPYYLLSQGLRDEAIASLAKLRSKPKAAVEKEADEIQVILDEAFKNQASFSELFKVKANFKALIYTCLMVSFQQFTGITVVEYYLQDIFIAAGGLVSMEIAPIVIGVVRVLASTVTPMVVDRSGRKILLVFSGIGETISLFALGLYFYLKEVQHADDVVEQISWLPVVSLIIFMITFSIGWDAIPWAMTGEMFASNVKASASSITVFVCWFLAFVTTKFSINLDKAFHGMYATFWMFAGLSFLSIFFTVLFLPETKGKTLQQIQDELNGVTCRERNENVKMENSRPIILTNGVRINT
ncbi:facilitated trehalose transporter Tret1-like isoform X2 [Temnothorax curvispinosus]|uniref:Facilitated trehalose transporter Tret1-like isoform X2 n=1 Tax=Temnothorax curvispinosus TaxID=300111 RepID=A0A6J1QU60_9HYME|nr:facilitated trehalose transporter Tret1-like isoform X2 [Temnothorax curvispinosus]